MIAEQPCELSLQLGLRSDQAHDRFAQVLCSRIPSEIRNNEASSSNPAYWTAARPSGASPGSFEQDGPLRLDPIQIGVVIPQRLRVLAIARYVKPRPVDQRRAFIWILGRRIAHVPVLALVDVKVLPLGAPEGLHDDPAARCTE